MKITKRQKTIEYEVYIAVDGKEFESMQECLDYEKTLKKVTCNKCRGNGRVQGKFVEDFYNYDIGHIPAHYEWDECKKCKGYGYIYLKQ